MPALSLVLSRLPASIYLAAVTLFLAVPVALGLGAWSARNPDGWLTRAIDVFSLGGVSTVDFWFGFMLIILFAVNSDGCRPELRHTSPCDPPSVCVGYRPMV